MSADRRRQCGSDNGYRMHLKGSELPCSACTEAHRIANRDWRVRTGRARQLKPCGTRAAYKRHLRAGDRPCWRCTWANRYGRDFVETGRVAA